MKHLVLLVLCLTAGLKAYTQSEKEKIIRNYFSGWEKKDWSIVAKNLAEGFTFTSPAPDDHINAQQFKDKCWVEADHVRTFEFPKIAESGNQAFAIVHVMTMDNRVIRNVEFFTFEGQKIKSIEVFFGGNGQGFPTNKK
jgi:hypothetical protein